jgi:hypothetical protein
MGPLSATIAIDAPRERVCELISDLAARPAFTDHFISDYQLTRLDPVGVGAAARFRFRDSGSWLDSAIEEIEAPHLVRERGFGGRWNRIPVNTVWELVEGPSRHGCEVTVTFWTEPPDPLARLREGFGSPRSLRRDFSRALGRLRAIAESEGHVHRVAVAGLDRPGI